VDGSRVRIDKWLWAARFFKTRSLAARAVDLGRVRLQGERIKPARELHVGDVLHIDTGVELEVEVVALSDVRGPAPAARLLYAETAVSEQRRVQRAALRALDPDPEALRKGRPTKREGRALRRLKEDGA
jgi:ribosome-associated heat shock protein Hsp15